MPPSNDNDMAELDNCRRQYVPRMLRGRLYATTAIIVLRSPRNQLLSPSRPLHCLGGRPCEVDQFNCEIVDRLFRQMPPKASKAYSIGTVHS
eukprot:scaffold54786_cov27-Prasinocladus_malaysianus.AAC.1